jgi:hypothetical protein
VTLQTNEIVKISTLVKTSTLVVNNSTITKTMEKINYQNIIGLAS